VSDPPPGPVPAPPEAGTETRAARAIHSPAPAIELEGLGRRFGERVALSGISVRVDYGKTLAVFGPNGAGKTTLLRVLATLLRPHGGAAHVLGAELPKDAWKVRGRVGYLGHEPLLYRELSGRQNLRYHAQLHGVDDRRVEELLAAVGMERRSDEPVRELSRGMVQRLAAARAVLHDPVLLLLDEPRAGLDPAAVERLYPLIGRQSGRTRVLVTHDVEGGLAESDAALGLHAGRQAFALPAFDVDPAGVRELYR
jgi:heme exporter protein A